jgi:phage terminase Nu1 subunit (DNA packaging protein)
MELTVAETAARLLVSDRQVRNWIKDHNLPTGGTPSARTLDWTMMLPWYVSYTISQRAGNGGNLPLGNEAESYQDALARKTRAEADLKELELARSRAEVASIADLERVLVHANKTIQTQILGLPSMLAPDLLSIDDQTQIYNSIDRACRDLLSNLASSETLRDPAAAGEDEP